MNRERRLRLPAFRQRFQTEVKGKGGMPMREFYGTSKNVE